MISFFQVLGGLALFLFGVRILSDGMEKLAGHRLQEWLDRMTNRPLKGAAFGAGATALVQSSSLLMVTMVGLVNANMMTLEQSIGVMMGVEIGTTLTAQIAAFEMGDLSYLFVAVGFVLAEFVSNRTWRRVGEVVLGFGILFLGMQVMSGALKAVANAPLLLEWLVYMGQYPLTGILAGAVATAVVQSSSAVTGLVVAMGMSGIITLPGAIGLLMGANIGTCATGFIASLQLSHAAKRAAIAQILINIIGTVLFLPFIMPFANLVSLTSSSLPRQIANAHTIFNIATSVVLFPFIGAIARTTRRLVPVTEDEEKPKLTRYIDDSQIRFPDLALSEAAKELHHIGEVSAKMIGLSRQALVENGTGAAQQVVELENEQVNPLCGALDAFLNELVLEDLDEEQQWHSFRLRRRLSDVERVADLAEDLALTAQGEPPPSAVLDAKVIEELDPLFRQTRRTYVLALQAIRDGDHDMAQLVCNLEEKMDRKYWKARKKLSKRSKKGNGDPEADALHLEILRNLERISDHADNLGVSVMRT
jgi:phosphate:Na+ symporter